MTFICLRLFPLPTLNDLKCHLVIRDQEFGMNNHDSSLEKFQPPPPPQVEGHFYEIKVLEGVSEHINS